MNSQIHFGKQKIYSIYNFGSNKIKGRILKLPSAVKEFKQIYGKKMQILKLKKNKILFIC